MLKKLKKWARQLKKQLFVLYFAYKDKRTPWYAKWFAVCVVAYAFSPIDLIPDFIPVLGYLDDVILVPLGVAVALKLLPAAVVRDCAELAEERAKRGKPKNWLAASLIIGVWGVALIWVSVSVYRNWIQ